MKSRKAALGEARKLIAAAQGVLGPRAVQQIVDALLPFVDRLRNGGASWDQIAVLLFEAGLRARKGGRVSADSLRAVASRARSRHTMSATSAPVASSGVDTFAAPTLRQLASEDRTLSLAAAGQARQSRADEAESHIVQSRELNERLRDRMRRAATIRGSPFEAEGSGD